MEQDFEGAASQSLVVVRGSIDLSDEKPTVWNKGDCWPPYGEVVTRFPLWGGSKLNVFVDRVWDKSTLILGLISPDDRELIETGDVPFTGKLWSWNSKTKTVCKKAFDSEKTHGASSQTIMYFYNMDIRSEDKLCVYRNLKTNRIHFVINGEEAKIPVSRDVSDHCFGYVRMNSANNYSSIQLTLRTEKDNCEPGRVEPTNGPVNKDPWWLPVVQGFSRLLPSNKAKQIHQEQELKQHSSHETKKLREKCTQLEQENIGLQERLKESERRYTLETREPQEEVVKLQMECNQQEQEKVELQNRSRDATGLGRYEIGDTPRGICLVINNVNFLDEPDERRGSEIDEKEITVLFSEELHFIVETRRNLGGQEILNTAQEFAAEDHSKYTAFAFFIMSHGDEKDVIQGVDGRKARVEDLMYEFTPKNCSTLANKPKLLFIQACRGQGTDRRMNRLSASPDWSIEGDTFAIMQSSDSTLANGFSPREADFLLAFATVPGYKAWRSKNSGSWFVQVLVDVIRKYHRHHHLLDMLTEVNKQVADIANNNPDVDLPFQVPAPTHTLRKQVYL